MSISGTDAYAKEPHLPPLVERALAAARAHGFAHFCRPEQGRLLPALDPDPLAEFAREALGRVVRGAVAKAAPFGVFVRLAEGVEGLVHRDTLVGSAVPGVGAELSVEVSDVNLHRRRVVLRPAP